MLDSVIAALAIVITVGGAILPLALVTASVVHNLQLAKQYGDELGHDLPDSEEYWSKNPEQANER